MRILNKLPAFLAVSSAALASSVQKPLGHSSSQTGDASSAPHYRDTLLALHKSLVEIPSVNGNENEVGSFLVDYLTDLGFHAQLEFIPPPNVSSSYTDGQTKPRFNVLAWPGKSRNPSPKVLVSSHIDTVPPFIPYAVSDKHPGPDTVISGRGSVDAKAAVAAQITALLDLMTSQTIDGAEVMLLYVVGEETTGDGMRYFSSTLGNLQPPPQFKAGIFGEPTEGKLACGHKGFLGCTVMAKGHAGHSGYPWLGKSATEVLMRALVKVLDTDLGSSERYGNTTVNVGRIEGGVALNVIPERAEAALALRLAIGPQDTGAGVVKERLWNALKSVDEEALHLSCVNGYGAVDCNCEVDGKDFRPTIAVH
jgi:acetylornithine deacetylase